MESSVNRYQWTRVTGEWRSWGLIPRETNARSQPFFCTQSAEWCALINTASLNTRDLGCVAHWCFERLSLVTVKSDVTRSFLTGEPEILLPSVGSETIVSSTFTSILVCGRALHEPNSHWFGQFMLCRNSKRTDRRRMRLLDQQDSFSHSECSNFRLIQVHYWELMSNGRVQISISLLKWVNIFK